MIIVWNSEKTMISWVVKRLPSKEIPRQTGFPVRIANTTPFKGPAIDDIIRRAVLKPNDHCLDQQKNEDNNLLCKFTTLTGIVTIAIEIIICTILLVLIACQRQMPVCQFKYFIFTHNLILRFIYLH